MRSNEDFEKIVKKDLDVRASDGTHERMRRAVLDAHERPQTNTSAPTLTTARRMLMRSSLTKLGAAAAIVIAVMLGLYVMTGSVDGTSITIAQVRQALQDVDWVRMTNKMGKEVAWYSFGSKIQALVNGEGRIIFFDFNAGKRQVWSPGSEVIYESPIQETRQFAGGISGLTEGVNRMFDSLEKKGWDTTKGLGIYEDRKVEVWAARGPREGRPGNSCAMTMYIDVEKKLPVGIVDEMEAPDGAAQVRAEARFEYPKTGPTDIYAAGAPRSAPIKPAPEQQPSGEQTP
jgi:hypothetical protein